MAFSMICSSCGKPMTARVEAGTSSFCCEACGFEFASSCCSMPPEEAAKFMRTTSRHLAWSMMVAHLPTAVIAAALVGILAWLLTRSAAVTLTLAGVTLFALLLLAAIASARWQQKMFDAMRQVKPARHAPTDEN